MVLCRPLPNSSLAVVRLLSGGLEETYEKTRFIRSRCGRRKSEKLKVKVKERRGGETASNIIKLNWLYNLTLPCPPFLPQFLYVRYVERLLRQEHNRSYSIVGRIGIADRGEREKINTPGVEFDSVI